MAQQQQNGEPVMRRYVQFHSRAPAPGTLVKLQFCRSLYYFPCALSDHCAISSLVAVRITHRLRIPSSNSPVKHPASAPAMTCVNSLECLELLHPGFCAIACIGVPGPTTRPTKNSPPYRHPMPTFYRLALHSFSFWSICISKTPLRSDTHSRSRRCCTPC
jgi:hypothetical protein